LKLPASLSVQVLQGSKVRMGANVVLTGASGI